ncbi:MAG TPA: imidazolonepropionase [Edaphocola sp.]|nr:imidazolonepropionase [Edaphocola sp.]
MLSLIANIKTLFQTRKNSVLRVNGLEMKELPHINNAFLIIEDGLIHSFGKMDELPLLQFSETMDASGKLVLPSWIDSHTHLVFATSREQEFVDKINGLSYAEIAAKGGGILNSARKLGVATEEDLFDAAAERLEKLIALGTGAIEVKSGYGLNTAAELKMLKVIQKLKEHYDHIPIKASFLAAHAYPPEYKDNHQGYIDLIINEMLPKVADEGLADYMDVFCEEGFFSVSDTEQLLEAGWKYGLKPKIHANQLHRSGGVQVGVKHDAVSVDHLESMGQEEVDALSNSHTIPTLLPGAAFFLGMHYQPARMLIDADLPVCLASDFNPGSCPSGNMNLLMSIACTQLKMTPEEVVNAQTINGAAAMEIEEQMGSITPGKKASLIITKPVPSLAYLPYAYGENLIERVIV